METGPNVQSNMKAQHGMRHKKAHRRSSMSKVRSPLLDANNCISSDPTNRNETGNKRRSRQK